MNFYNITNKDMLASNAIFDGDTYHVNKNQEEIDIVRRNYLCRMDIIAAELLTRVHKYAEEALDGNEEVSDVITIEGFDFEINIFDMDGYYYCDVIDTATREFFYAWDEYGPHKVCHFDDYKDNESYDVNDPNMYYAAMPEFDENKATDDMTERKNIISEDAFGMINGFWMSRNLKKELEEKVIDACADGAATYTYETDSDFYVSYWMKCENDTVRAKMYVNVTAQNGREIETEKEYEFSLEDDISGELVSELFVALTTLEFEGMDEDEEIND